jgi:hypothetical protein
VKQHVTRFFQEASQATIKGNEVEIALARDKYSRPVAFEPFDEMLAQETGATGYGDTFVCPESSHECTVLFMLSIK